MSIVYHSEEHQAKFKQRIADAGLTCLDDDTLKTSLSDFINKNDLHDEVWIFGYGSLIWNPQLNYSEKETVTIEGFERDFCIRSVIGYGIEEQPGLMLGIQEKSLSCCTGIAYKIKNPDLQEQLYHYWQREMRVDIYIPTIIEHKINNKTDKLLILSINKKSSLYMGKLPLTQKAKMISRGQGIFGNNTTYLNKLVTHLHQYGIEDNYMNLLQQTIKEAAY